MSITAIQDHQNVLFTDPHLFVEERILEILKQDRESWVRLITKAARGEMFIPRTPVPHIHPASPKVPCMVCAAHSRDLTTVSAVILLSLSEVRYREDHWNADRARRADQVISAATSVVSDRSALADMFGPHWGLVLSLAYRIEFANAETLVGLLRKALETPGSSTILHSDRGRDWTQPARWLVSNAMSGRRSAVKSPTRPRHTVDSGRLMGMASVYAMYGNPENSVEEWVVSDPRDFNDPNN